MATKLTLDLTLKIIKNIEKKANEPTDCPLLKKFSLHLREKIEAIRDKMTSEITDEDLVRERTTLENELITLENLGKTITAIKNINSSEYSPFNIRTISEPRQRQLVAAALHSRLKNIVDDTQIDKLLFDILNFSKIDFLIYHNQGTIIHDKNRLARQEYLDSIELSDKISKLYTNCSRDHFAADFKEVEEIVSHIKKTDRALRDSFEANPKFNELYTIVVTNAAQNALIEKFKNHLQDFIRDAYNGKVPDNINDIIPNLIENFLKLNAAIAMHLNSPHLQAEAEIICHRVDITDASAMEEMAAKLGRDYLINHETVQLLENFPKPPMVMKKEEESESEVKTLAPEPTLNSKKIVASKAPTPPRIIKKPEVNPTAAASETPVTPKMAAPKKSNQSFVMKLGIFLFCVGIATAVVLGGGFAPFFGANLILTEQLGLIAFTTSALLITKAILSGIYRTLQRTFGREAKQPDQLPIGGSYIDMKVVNGKSVVPVAAPLKNSVVKNEGRGCGLFGAKQAPLVIPEIEAGDCPGTIFSAR